MKIERIALNRLSQPERNFRMHTKKQLQEFRRSVEKFGQIRPIVCDEALTILAGNGLYLTLKEMGWAEADVYVVPGLSDLDKNRLMVADNKIYSLGVDDYSAFEEMLKDFTGGYDIPGYDETLLQTMMADAESATNAIRQYGVLSQDEAQARREQGQRMEAAVRRQEAPAAPAHADMGSPAPTAADSAPPAPSAPEPAAGSRRRVICPKCGEALWV